MIPKRPIYFAIAAIYIACASASAQDWTYPPAYSEGVLPIMGWAGPPFDYREWDRYYEAGYTVGPTPPSPAWSEIFRKLPELDMVAMYTLPEPRKLSPKTFVKFAKEHQSSYGWILKDEAKPADVPALVEEIRALRELDPTLKTMVILDAQAGLAPWRSALPTLLEAGLSIVCLKRFHFPDSTETDEAGFHETIAFAQAHASAHDAETWAMIQVTPFDGHRRASESDIRLQAYTALALGARGLVHYAYWEPPYASRYTEWGPAMIDPKTRVGSYGYEMSFYVNREVRRLAKHFLNLEATGHYYVGQAFEGAPTQKPSGSPIVRVVAERALVREFRGGTENDSWALLVNRRHGHFSAAASTSSTIQVILDESVEAVHEIDRYNEYEKPIPLEHNSFFITTPGGTGNLLRFTYKKE